MIYNQYNNIEKLRNLEKLVSFPDNLKMQIRLMRHNYCLLYWKSFQNGHRMLYRTLVTIHFFDEPHN